MPTHKPDFGVLTVSQLAQLTGRKRETVRRKLEGLVPVREDGRACYYRARDALAAIFDSELDLTRERARLAREQSELTALRVEEARGGLIPLEDAEQAIVALLSGLRAQLLAIPVAIAEELVVADTPGACEAILRAEICAALETVADAEVRIPEEARARRRKRTAPESPPRH